MAREILFKAKTEMIVRTYNNGLDDGEWVQGYLRCDCGMWLIYQFEYDRADQVAYEVNPETICQYTGLTDKNGNKIWENDVVEYSDETYRVHFVVRYGEYHNDGNKDCYVGFYADWFQTLDSKYLRKDIGFWVYNREIEVICNIFDNPELLGGAENG